MIIINKNATVTNPQAGSVGSFIRYVKPPIKTLCGLECNFACGDCDSPFSYLLSEDDVLRMQFNVPDYYNPDPTDPAFGWDTGSGGWLQADILDSSGEVAIKNVTLNTNSQYTAGFATGYTDGTFWQNLNLNVGAIVAEVGECFSVRLAFCGRRPNTNLGIYTFSGFFTELPDPRDYEGGKSVIVTDPTNVFYTLVNGAWVAPSPQPDFAAFFFEQTTGVWWAFDLDEWSVIQPPTVISTCDQVKFCNTATFQLNNCNLPMLCFDSVPTGSFDCAGNYYGTQGTTQAVGDSAYRNAFCVLGSLERIGFEVVRETTSQGRVTQENTTSIYRLRAHVPEVVAERIKNAMLPQGFTINGLIFDTFDSITKDNDDSSMWHIDMELRVKDCDNVDSCL